VIKLLHLGIGVLHFHPANRPDRGRLHAFPVNFAILMVASLYAPVTIVFAPIQRLSLKQSPFALFLPPPKRKHPWQLSSRFFEESCLKRDRLNEPPFL